jgi:hypothetical protein
VDTFIHSNPISFSVSGQIGANAVDGIGGAGEPPEPPPPTPDTIAGMVQWLQPDPDTMYADTDFEAQIVPVNGQGVVGWQDQSGVDNHATQGGAGLIPQYQTNIQNGLPMILYDGVNDYHACNSMAQYFDGADAPFTLAMVFKQTTAGAPTLYGSRNDADTDPYIVTGMNAAEYFCNKRDDAGAFSLRSSTGVTADLGAHILILRHNGTTVDMWVDGVQCMTALASNVGTLTLDNATIGAEKSGVSASGFLEGYIGEVIVYDNALSNGNVDVVEAYLSDEWSIPI